jgi:micrococcal nuclease
MDTIKINMNGKTETLRLIGIDTPETVDPRKPVQCFGKEASNKAKELLSGKKVRIELDPTQGERDKYDRLLAYVYRDDGLFYNKYMIEQGYAHEYTYNTPYKYQAEFKAAQKSAQANQAGLWSPTTCNGDTTSSSQTAPATTQSSSKFYTSSHYSAKYYYPESCDGWKSLSSSYLKSFDTLEALLASYNRTKSPQCE